MAEKEVKIKVAADVDDEQVKELEALLNSLADKVVGFEVAVDDDGLDAAGEKEEGLNGSAEFVIDVDDAAVQQAMTNLSDGVGKAKQGVLDLKNAIQEIEQAGMQSEQNKAFLEMNLGAEEAATQYQRISDIVASMPGDDNTMRSVLSTAQALGNDLNPQEMEAATKTMADYMAGSATMGKMATESQQDIMKYLLDGNTAELERGSIVSSQVDKLKEANTFQERQAAMQQVLNDLGYGGISTQDTMLNKQAEWEGMLYNSQDALSSMWLGAEKGAMDYILQLNDATGGLVGMGIVGGQMVAGPLTEVMSGIGQIGIGLKTLKDAGDFTGISGKLGTLKTALIGVGSKAKEAALGLLNVGKNAMIAGWNALKSAAMWVVQKAQLVATTIANYATAAAQWALNIAMSMNPIAIVVIALVALAAALIWAYQNVDWFREMVNNAWASIQVWGQQIYSFIAGALAGLKNAIMVAWNFIVNHITNAFNNIRNIIFIGINYWNIAKLKAQEIANGIRNAFNGIKGQVQSAFNGVTHAITAPFMSAYNTLKPIIDNIKAAWDMLMGIGGSAGITAGSAGISMGGVNGIGSANTNLISNISNVSGGRPNIIMNGIIEESAGEFIVRKLDEEIYKQNVIRGVE